MSKLILSKDPIEPFIPKKKPKMIIFGTMAAVVGRILDGVPQGSDTFYYHNNVNRFWTVLRLLKDHQKPFETVAHKKEFFETHRIAILNITSEMKIKKSDAENASDFVLFDAFKRDQLKVRKIKQSFKDLILDPSIPIYFTSRSKPQLIQILERFFEENDLPRWEEGRIHFLPSPTRRSAANLKMAWEKEMAAHQAQNCHLFKNSHQ